MDKVENNSLIPEIYCSLIIINTSPDTHDDLLKDLVSALTRPPNVIYSEDIITYELSTTGGYMQAWEIVDVLNEVLSDIHIAADEIKAIVKKHNAQLLIDIAFYHYDRYPALVFDGPAMRLINYLNADISIDAY